MIGGGASGDKRGGYLGQEAVNGVCREETRSGSIRGLQSRAAFRFFMKVAELIRILREDGWYLAATRGSHRQFKHPTKRGRVTVAGKPSDDLAPGTVKSILKQSGLKR
jgi:predicted RNA binding protein YcfA (HicA-like mRNA interferase family)